MFVAARIISQNICIFERLLSVFHFFSRIFRFCSQCWFKWKLAIFGFGYLRDIHSIAIATMANAHTNSNCHVIKLKNIFKHYGRHPILVQMDNFVSISFVCLLTGHWHFFLFFSFYNLNGLIGRQSVQIKITSKKEKIKLKQM